MKMDIRAVSTVELGIPGPRAASDKNQSRIEPLAAPDFYARHFDGHENEILVADKMGDVQKFEFMHRVDDPKTSMAASVFLNKQDGHAVIFYKGTDLPIVRDEGSGRFLGFAKDVQSVWQAWLGGVNQQTAPAENVYLDTLNNPQVKSVELIGYSIGSQHLNYLAAKHGARGTAIADMGISTRVLTSVFNRGTGDDSKPSYSLNEITQSMRERVTVLDLDKDKLPKWASAGPSLGTIIALDSGTTSDWMALLHIPQVYAAKAASLLEEKESQRSKPASDFSL